MKRLLLFLAFLGALQANAQSDFAPMGAKWYYNYSSSSSHPYLYEYEVFEVTGTTILAGQQMKVITGKRWDGRNNQLVPTDTVYVSATPDTVFYFHKKLQRIVPLYVFNVQAGDTLRFYKPFINASVQDSFFKCVVDSVTTLSVNGRSLRRVYSSPPYGQQYMWDDSYAEMIGGLFYMLPWTLGKIPEEGRGLRCYIDPQLTFHYFAFGLVNACDAHGPPAVVSALPVPAEWQVSPNPASGELSVTGISGKSFSYNLYSIDGRSLLSGTAKAPVMLPVMALAGGTYLLHLKMGEKLFVQKVVVSP